jgi:hypothetical protein
MVTAAAAADGEPAYYSQALVTAGDGDSQHA